MAHLTIDLPDELEASLRREAEAAGKSLSAYIADLVRKRPEPARSWPSEFLATFGSWEGRLDRPRQLPLDEPA